MKLEEEKVAGQRRIGSHPPAGLGGPDQLGGGQEMAEAPAIGKLLEGQQVVHVGKHSPIAPSPQVEDAGAQEPGYLGL